MLARRVDPESDQAGRINLDMALRSNSPTLTETMANASGHVDFAVWPDDVDAGEFDLWAVNLLTVLLPVLDSTEDSQINCAIGRFRVEDGIMRPEAILIDSTNIQATGDGEVNFKTETVDLQLTSQAKQPQMFSAAPPVEVEGHFDDFGVGISAANLMGSVVRMAASPVMVPFQWVFSTPPAADGEAACTEAWDQSAE